MAKLFSLFLLLSQSLLAWESHYLLTYQALKPMSSVSQEATITPEPLENFVANEKLGLMNLLEQVEHSMSKNPLYPKVPESIRFNTQKNVSLTKQFFMALRVNPDLDYPLFILRDKPTAKEMEFLPVELKKAPLSTLAKLDDGKALKKVTQKEKLSPIAIIATGSEEPDHGMDFYLWDDNNSWFGAKYNLGSQPIGNPLLSFSSQAPFHMGFFHESFVLYLAGGFLKRCYPEYRINQFTMLSRYAFATNHPYWGYRFMGIALHYLQDLTQVYHARVAPVPAAKLIAINFLAIIGFDRLKREMTQILSNKHLGLESYQLGYVKHALSQTDAPILKALRDQSTDKNYGPFSETYPRAVVAKASYDKASLVDELVINALPKILQDARFNFDIHEGKDLFIEVNKKPDEAVKKLDQELVTLMRSFGAHTRKLVGFVQGVY
jgi:hypothetical protein